MHHEGIPVLDMARVKHYLEGSKTRLIGPNCPGALSRVCARLAFCRGISTRKATWASSRSGTLTYEAVKQLTSRGIRADPQRSGIGGDPIRGTGFVDALRRLRKTPTPTPL